MRQILVTFGLISRHRFNSILLIVLLLFTGGANAGPPATAYVAVIIDDLGNSWSRGLQAIHLPGPVAFAILPHLPYSTRLARRAHGQRKDIILHLPMESLEEKEKMGPGGLYQWMGVQEVVMTLKNSLENVPHAVAINNHMGSLLTQDRKSMGWLMQAVRQENKELFFIDSLTDPGSVAMEQATEHGIPSLERSVFLDNERSPEAIERQFDKLLRAARRQGAALGIGHPYPETLEVLERRLRALASGEVRLVPVSMLVAMKIQEKKPW